MKRRDRKCVNISISLILRSFAISFDIFQKSRNVNFFPIITKRVNADRKPCEFDSVQLPESDPIGVISNAISELSLYVLWGERQLSSAHCVIVHKETAVSREVRSVLWHLFSSLLIESIRKGYVILRQSQQLVPSFC